MELYPAIDIRGGRCVRLHQGDFGQETVYGDDPVAEARRFAGAGTRWIHVVDLDAARSGEPVNRAVVAAVAGAVAPDGVRVQAGGGVRSMASAELLAASGVARVVVGTAALERPDLVAGIAARVPVALGLDVRGRDVAVRGWTQASGSDVLAVLEGFAGVGLDAVVVTQISRDGTLAGPDLDVYRELLRTTELPVIASGGIGRLDDLRALAALEVGDRQLEGAIVGTALYEGVFTVEEALACASRV
ncbi:MAG: HisA/HisF-related TIM barrel protein [Acidimicrobiales bacterium]